MAAVTVSPSLAVSKQWLLNCTIVLAFFPFISLIPGMTAEVQPYCYLLAWFVLVTCQNRLPLALFVFFALVLSYFFYYFLASYTAFSFDFKALPHLIIYLGPPVFFYLLLTNAQLLQWRYLHAAFYTWIFVGTIQQLFPAAFEVTGINTLLGYFIPRYSGERLAEIGRGVTSLSNEPSYAAIVIFSGFMIALYRYVKQEIKPLHFAFDCVLYVWAVFINASVTGFLLFLIIILSAFYYKRKLLLFISIAFLAGFILLNVDTETRSLAVIKELPDLLEANNWSIYDILVYSQGSVREFSTLVALKSSLFHIWGNGYYSSLNSFIEVARSLGFDLNKVIFFMYDTVNGYVNMKPFGYGALILFELGLLPFLLINYYLIKTIWSFYGRGGRYKRLGFFLALHALLFLNFNTVASLPSYWIELFVALQIMIFSGGKLPVQPSPISL